MGKTDGLCGCGCGELTRVYSQTIKSEGAVKGQPRRYVAGHQWRDPAVRAQMSEVRKKQGNGALGRRLSEETKAKIGAAHRGQSRPAISAALKGKPKSPETRAKISAALKARPKGARRAEPRNDDRIQARDRVNALVKAGVLPAPKDLPCSDCGQVWKPGPSRHEYDHYLGYAAEHHEDVQVVCSACHHQRGKA